MPKNATLCLYALFAPAPACMIEPGIEAEPAKLSTTTQASIMFSNQVLSMGPLGYWRLGEPAGTIANDSSPTNVAGTYHNTQLGLTGSITNDNNPYANFHGTGASDGSPPTSSYAEIPDHRVFSLTRAWDNFDDNGSVSNWGSLPNSTDLWNPQVTLGQFYSTSGGIVRIEPNGQSGTFQQGVNTSLLYGDMQVRATWSVRAQGGPLQPLALVAQRVDDLNFVKAELVENNNHKLDLVIVKVTNGVNTQIAFKSNVGTYTLFDWWYLRFQFEGTTLRARAWRKGTQQPRTWDVSGTAAAAAGGTVAVRSTNSNSSARPIVSFDDFWVQTIGFSVHLLIRISAEQPQNPQDPPDAPGAPRTYPIAKNEWIGGTQDREYLLRYHHHTNGDFEEKHLKAYHGHYAGGLGAGQDVKVCPTLPPNETNCPTSSTPIWMNTWHQVVMEFDSGDHLDSQAGVSLYVDGELMGAPQPGAWYNGSFACADAVYNVFANDGTPGVPGTCGLQTNNECTPKLPSAINASSCSPNAICPANYDCLVGNGSGNLCTPGMTGCYCSLTPRCSSGCASCIPAGQPMAGYCKLGCWNVEPFSGEGHLRLGTREFNENGVLDYWKGGIDELAIFPRKLSQAEVDELWDAYSAP